MTFHFAGKISEDFYIQLISSYFKVFYCDLRNLPTLFAGVSFVSLWTVASKAVVKVITFAAIFTGDGVAFIHCKHIREH